MTEEDLQILMARLLLGEKLADVLKEAYQLGYDKGFSDNYSEGEGV